MHFQMWTKYGWLENVKVDPVSNKHEHIYLPSQLDASWDFMFKTLISCYNVLIKWLANTETTGSNPAKV